MRKDMLEFCPNCGKYKKFFHLDEYCISCSTIADEQYHYYQMNQDIYRKSTIEGFCYYYLPDSNVQARIIYPYLDESELYTVRFYVIGCDMPVTYKHYTNEDKAHRASYLWCLLASKD